MGNILFLSGVMLTIGLKSTMQFFAKPKNYKGTISFGVGFFLVLIGWPVIGMIMESYGFIILFRHSLVDYYVSLVYPDSQQNLNGRFAVEHDIEYLKTKIPRIKGG
ncbi:hypothetical protein Cni_G26107 [Canna indica]|uniref:Uncharacterized protein n=1 Tax=Canna indica TaxID=4628 RepID=A0AAQ3QLP1_9LILI|nr:hypothetical protein Cni_G26107 [Canna indica]